MTNSYQAGDVAISGLPALSQNALATADELAIVDVDAQETKKIGTEAFFLGALSLLPPGSIDGNLIVYSTPPAVTPGQIPDGSITGVKLADNSGGIYAATLPPSGDFIGQTCILTDGSVYVWTGSTWLSAASTSTITAAELADNSSGIWTNTGGAPGSNGNFIGQIAVSMNGKAYMWSGLSWYPLTADVLDGSITGVKLADNSSARFFSGTNNLTGQYIGQLAIDNASGAASAWTGTAWVNLSGDVYTGVAGSVVDVNIDAATRQISAALQNTSAAGQFLAGPSGAAGAASYRAIAAADLPTAATGTAGIITPGTSVEVTNGTLDLVVQGTAQSTDYHLVTYNEYGIVTGSAPLTDTIVIPPATTTELGGIIAGTGLTVDATGTLSVDFTASTVPIADISTLGSVIVGGGLSATGTGVLSIDNSVTAGTFTKVTIDAYGLVTLGESIEEADIPDLDASILATGTINPLRFGNGTIGRDALADYAVTYIQEIAPTLNIGPTGVFWLKESTGELHAYNGNRWIGVTGTGGLNQPVTGFRYGGMVDGSTGNLIAVSDEGVEAGFVDGTALSGIVTESNVGIYFAVHAAGSSIGVIPNQTVAIGDWVLAASETDGWLYLDRSGTGAIIDPSQITLDELADVDADTPVDGDCLIYDGTNQIYETRKIVVSEIGDVALTSPSQGQVLQYDATNSTWVNGTGTVPVVSETPPTSPINDMLWVRPSTRRQYVYVTDSGGSSQWVSLACC